MNLQQLIELAILDAMGLLDDDERSQFESAYLRAAPAVQAQIRREQTRLAQIEALLPDVTPPAELRAAVLEAVRREMDAEPVSRQLLVPPMVDSRRVSPFWRMASVGLAAAVVVLSVALFEGYIQFKQVGLALQNDKLLQAMSKQFEGTVKDVLFNRDTERVVLQPVSQSFKGEASVFLNPEWHEGRFFYQGIQTADGRPMRLAVVDPDDRVVEVLAEITSDGELAHKAVNLRPMPRTRLALLSAGPDGQNTVLGRGEVPGPPL